MYGPSENAIVRNKECDKMVAFVRQKCKHTFNVTCDQAFNYASGEVLTPPCIEKICDFTSPLCRHRINISCHSRGTLESFDPWMNVFGVFEEGKEEGSNIFRELSLFAGDLKGLSKEMIALLSSCCNQKVQVRLSCDHVIDVNCGDLIKYISHKAALPLCKTTVTRPLACGHAHNVKCHTLRSAPPICNVSVPDVFMFSCNEHSIKPGKCSELEKLKSTKPPCTIKVSNIYLYMLPFRKN
jgi:hypothetical protein